MKSNLQYLKSNCNQSFEMQNTHTKVLNQQMVLVYGVEKLFGHFLGCEVWVIEGKVCFYRERSTGGVSNDDCIMNKRTVIEIGRPLN